MTSFESTRVTVIEDNPDNLMIIIDLLKTDLGMRHVNGWASGAMFFRWWRSAPSVILNPHYRHQDLILLDLQLPREDGYGVLATIRQEPVLATIPVIAVTANVLASDVEKARLHGFDGFIGKPLDFVRFPEQIRRILAGDAVWEVR